MGLTAFNRARRKLDGDASVAELTTASTAKAKAPKKPSPGTALKQTNKPQTPETEVSGSGDEGGTNTPQSQADKPQIGAQAPVPDVSGAGGEGDTNTPQSQADKPQIGAQAPVPDVSGAGDEG